MIKVKGKTNEILKLPCLECISVGRAYDILRADVQELEMSIKVQSKFTPNF